MWTTVTNDALRAGGGIRYRWGRRSEGTRTDPATAGLSLFNPDGKYSSRNPTSPYFGQLGRNTPVRISHGGANVALVIPSGVRGRATTPDTAALDITGDLDVRADLTPSVWACRTGVFGWSVFGKYNSTTNQRSWLMAIRDDGVIEFRWSADGTAFSFALSTLPLPFGPGERGAVRATLDVNNGIGGYTVAFYTAPTLAGSWTQLGTSTVTTGGTTSIFNSTSGVEVGDIASNTYAPVSRQYHGVEIRSGIGGSVVADPDFSAQASGTTSFADGAGRTWSTANGGEVTSRRIRAVLEASAWSPRWSSGGLDVTTPVEASGILRRLGQGDKALASTLRRRLPTQGPVAYWPMEDGRDSIQASSPISGCPPLTVGDLAFGQDDTCPGSSALPVVGDAAFMYGLVPAYTSSTNGYMVSLLYNLDAMPASSSSWLAFSTTGTARGLVMRFTSTTVVADLYALGGSVITTEVFSNAGVYAPGTWFRFDCTAQLNGSNTDFHFGFVDVDAGGVQYNFSIAGTPGRVTDIQTGFGTLLAGMKIGHVGIFPSSDTSIWGTADNGYRGETAADRMLRLGTEEGLSIVIAPSSAGSSSEMGPQRPSALQALLYECEDADGGILYEDRERAGLCYRSRSTLYNQAPKATLAYSQLVTPLEPVDDDTTVRNDITVARTGGSSARAILTSGPMSVAAPPDGVGTYDDSRTLSLATDGQCDDVAYWLLHRGTWDEARYPRVRILLHKYPALIPTVAALCPGDIIRITDLPAFLPPGPLDLMVEGAEEEIRSLEWTITLTCSPAGPWTVGVMDDPVRGRADTSGTVLSAGVDTNDTILSLTTATGPLWTTDLGDTPFDVQVGGEVMTVTEINGSRQDRFQRTVSSGWGTSDAGQAWTTTGGSAADYSVAVV
ncbi:hypothetical protein [Streptomyces sp. NBC_01264]|uniref:hypothetical protein n=1 Tax=Streptomyces sp. NBC_01264 TaxID=2903804 RepID=UPI002253FCFE|nr:hypothetical protein [Streptomyces sp. NBC_01264]MCX4778177.1 hypothetical protein [Streptomyces sp. NBC_01264]